MVLRFCFFWARGAMEAQSPSERKVGGSSPLGSVQVFGLRFFVAVPVSAKVQDAIGAEVLPFFSSFCFKPVAKHNLHFTLCFIGERGEGEKDSLLSSLSSVSFSAFSVSLSGLRHFRKSVFWLGVSLGGDKLVSLSELVCSSFGLSCSAFPHLTVARARRGFEREAFRSFSGIRSDFSFEFLVDRVSLFSSVLLPSGPAYKELGFRILSRIDSGS